MRARRHIITLIVASSLFMQNLDSTILGTALATIARSFGTDPVRLHMALTAYLLSLAVFMPVSGWIADRFGTRTVFQLAVGLFTAASIACAFAPSFYWLIAARVVQGAGGALMVPVARLALLRAVPKSELVNAMSWMAIPALVGPILGPPVGGFIVTYWSWPWIFWINVPVGIVSLILAGFYLDNTREPQVPRFDSLGFTLLAVGFSGLIIGFETVGETAFPRWINALAILCGFASLATYAVYSRRRRSPILDLSLLQVPTFFASVVGGGLFRVGIGALPFLLPLMLQAGFGYSPLSSGMTTLAAAIGALSMKFGAEALINRFGFRLTLIWNTLLSAAFAAGCMFFTPQTPAAIIFLVLLIGGFFRSLTFTAVNVIGYVDLEAGRLSQASGFTAVVQQLSLSLGVGSAAMILSLLKHGDDPLTPSDFVIPFAFIGVVMLISTLLFVRLSADAGREATALREAKEPA